MVNYEIDDYIYARVTHGYRRYPRTLRYLTPPEPK